LFGKTPLKAQNRYVFFGPLLATPMLLTTHCNFFVRKAVNVSPSRVTRYITHWQ